jgi:4-amino-4-deoxy-L-arabinose transferase-like glycosyltransferase
MLENPNHPEAPINLNHPAEGEEAGEEQDREPEIQPAKVIVPGDSSRRTSILTLLGSAAMVAASLWLHQQNWMQTTRWLSWTLLLGGISLFIFSRRSMEGKSTSGWLDRPLARLMSLTDLTAWQLGGLASSLLLALVAFQAAGWEAKMNAPYLAVGTWLAAIYLAMASGWQPAARRWSLDRLSILLLAVLALLALAIRMVQVSSIPVVLSGDEASSGLSAIAFINGETNNVFRSGWFSFPAMYSFLQAIPIQLFGQSIFALRILSIIAGSLTVGALFLAARAMFGLWTAIFSALFLATFHFHNNFSRIGLNNIWDGLWFMTVLGLLWYGWQREERRALLLAGLSLGLSQYFYVSVRLLFAIVPLWLLLVGVLDRPRLQRNLSGLILMAAVALATVLPLALFFLRFPSEFVAPMNRVSILGEWLAHEVRITGKAAWQILANQMYLSFQAYAHTPLRAWYAPGIPLLRPIPATLFFLGCGLLLLKPRDGRMSLLALWLISFTVMGGLSESTPAAQRYVAVAPAIAMMVGYGLSEISAQMSSFLRRPAGWVNALALVAILLISADELRFYFLEYTPRSDFGGDNTLVAHKLGHYLADKPADWQVVFFGAPRMSYHSIMSTKYLAPKIAALDMEYPWGSAENPQPTSSRLVFVFLPEHEADLKAVMASSPGGSLKQEWTGDHRLLYWLYEYPAAEASPGADKPERSADPHPISLMSSGGMP